MDCQYESHHRTQEEAESIDSNFGLRTNPDLIWACSRRYGSPGALVLDDLATETRSGEDRSFGIVVTVVGGEEGAPVTAAPHTTDPDRRGNRLRRGAVGSKGPEARSTALHAGRDFGRETSAWWCLGQNDAHQ